MVVGRGCRNVALTPAPFAAMHPIMRFFRQLFSDATCGGPLAALIGVLMALQALIGGFGIGTMSLAAVEQGVICSADSGELAHHQAAGGTHSQDGSHKKDCCLTACQVAASAHAGIAGRAPVPAFSSAAEPVTGFVVAAIDLSPRNLGTSRTARGPPRFPI
jgi:hypothetical protein